MELKEQINEWLKPLLEEQNLFLVDVRVSGKLKVEVFVDGDSGITISQCADVSRFLEKHLDGSPLLADNYVLDVSSPGMENPLKVPRQFMKRIGSVLEIVKTDGTELMAQLMAADEEGIKIMPVRKTEKKKKPITGKASAAGVEKDAPLVDLAYAEVKKAVLHFEW